MMGKHALSFLFLLATVLEIASGLYFHLGENERKCFIEEIPDETTIIVNYRMEFFDATKQAFTNNNPGIGMQVMIKDPDLKVVLSATYGTEHKIVMVSSTHGEHVICMSTNSTAWFGGQQVRVHIDIQVGEHAIDYNQVAKKEKLSELQLRIRQLLDQVDQITKEQGYQRYREAIFRNTSESTNSRVLWWSITQTIVLLVMGAWQMRHLKSFFEAKKLV